ncbi:hypothetical protein [Armatimonas sp.]|uniref:hypothetical protein n=1 Tax=Armatimonas sp. TaxID=1872638 RepID=UPI00286A30C7|nr:hypothetical protein [Armatimonas sp.]
MKSTRKNFLSLSLLSISYLSTLSGCSGGGSNDGNPVTDLTGRVQGYLDYINNASTAWNNLIVTVKGKSNSGQTIEKVIPVDSNGQFSAEVPEGTYDANVKDKNGSIVEINVPGVVIKKSDTTLVRPNNQETIDIVPSGISIKTIEITVPTSSIPPGSTYTFIARVLDSSNNILSDWEPRWRLEGNVGTLDTRTGRLSANSGGSGKIVAFFYVGSRLVEAKADIVVQVENLSPAPTLYALRPSPANSSIYAIMRYNSRNGQEIGKTEIPNILGNGQICISSDGTMYVTVNSGTSNFIQSIKTDGSLGTPMASRRFDIEALGILPNGNIIGFNDDGFHIFNKDSGLVVRENILDNTLSTVYDIKTGPDGKLYVTALNTLSSPDTYVVRRYNISTDNISFDKDIVIFSTSGSNQPSSVIFASNGEMIIADIKGKRLLRYNLEGSPLGNDYSVPGLVDSALAIGRNIRSQNDETIFVLSSQSTAGIRRINFNNGTFSDIDTFFSSNNIIDLAMP